MTLCIAASCRHEGEPAVVTCADWQITGPFIAAEDYYKLRHYPKTTIMISGELGAADGFCFDLRNVVKEFDEIAQARGDFEPRVGQYIQKLREAATRHKRVRAEHHVAMNYGISLNRFYKKGGKLMPKQIYKKVLEEIKQIRMDVQTIIIYSGDDEHLILRTGPWGNAFWERNYVAIGSGDRIAMTVLCQSPHDRNMPLAACLVRVLGAKIAAERDPYVGRNTSVGIILAEGRRHDVSDEAWDYVMRKVRPPLLPAAAEDCAGVPVLGRLLADREAGPARQTLDPWTQAGD